MMSSRLDYKEDTKLAVDAEEQRAVTERLKSGYTASTPSYHFICECFFLTAKGLHLGIIKMIQDMYNLARVSACCKSLSCQPYMLFSITFWQNRVQTLELLAFSPSFLLQILTNMWRSI